MPEEVWRHAPLADLITLEYGGALPASMRRDGPLPVVGSNGEVGRHSEALVKGPGIVIGRKGTVGAVNWVEPDFWPIDTTYWVRSKGPHLRWLFWILARSGLNRLDSSTGVPGLNRGDAYRLVLPIPPKEEQRAIAAILDSAAEATRTTEQLLPKLAQLRQGMLVTLLTHGLDDAGRIRDPDQNPHEFRDSPLGRIPRGWQALTVEDLLADVEPAMRSGPFGSALLKAELVDAGIPLLGIDNVHVERFIDRYTRFVRPAKAKELSRYRVRPRDVMITIMGTVGRSCVVPDDIGEALSSKHTWTISFDQSKISPELACLQFNYAPWVLRHFRRDEQGGIMSAIRAETLRTTLLPVPPPEEAERIEHVLASASARLRQEAALLDKLRLLKAGLSADLLEGRVRSTSHAEGAA